MKHPTPQVASNPNAEHVARPPRRAAYLPVFIRRFRFLPILRVNAQLIDVSEQGVKLQFPLDIQAKPGSKFWIEIPNTVVAANVSGAAFFAGECRWYNSKDFTLGATFRAADDEAEKVKILLISTLAASGRLSV